MPRIKKEFILPPKVRESIARQHDTILPEKQIGKYKVGTMLYTTRIQGSEGLIYGFITLNYSGELYAVIKSSIHSGGRYADGWYVVRIRPTEA